MGARGIASLVLVLALLVILAGLVSDSGSVAFDTLSATIQDIPVFDNPFDSGVSTLYNNTYRFDSPSDEIGAIAPDPEDVWLGYFGCQNESNDRSKCISTDDGDRSFVRFSGGDAWGESITRFNMTPSGLADVDHAAIRGYSIMVSCRASLESARIPLVGFTPFSPGQPIPCPYGDRFGTVHIARDTPSGIPDIAQVNGFDATIEFSNSFGSSVPELLANALNGTVDVSYVRFDITYVSSASEGCVAPSGAWFPWADQVACAIGQFGETVWTGIRFVVNGAIFVGALGVYVGSIVVAGVGMFAVLFDLGAPSPFQELIDVMVVVMLGFLVISVVLAIRGGGGV